ncbi:hypothetical protein HPP92_004730 [Vanilla planifolia]|uniref:Uncharacterized protein n=1 Tax=Vanilla planifolia TaxID=51239 RepID=A0A835VEQ8_VANPL|nr:hypothetical protein HPP92_005087 [Vanilla planifolia]KAG0493736.1 hypothetical protein HPP92_004730 [Vanilla planifolia]
MAEIPKLLFIVVIDEKDKKANEKEVGTFRYTRSVLQSTLQFMGCKARHSFKISRRVFHVLRNQHADNGFTGFKADVFESDILSRGSYIYSLETMDQDLAEENVEKLSSIQFERYKRQTTVFVTRDAFLNVVCDGLSVYNYVGPNQKADLLLACRIRERKKSVTILLCGTSGCGKSTLSALLGSRLGITTVISTDSIRHMMRSFVDEKDNPLLWSSTYHAGECLDPVAVAEAKAKRQTGASQSIHKEALFDNFSAEKGGRQSPEIASGNELIGKKQMAIEGFKAQSEMVIDGLDRLITAWEDQKQSVIVEGVHLSLNFVMGLMKKHPSIIPFMIYITNEEKHKERFAVRAKYMAIDPAKNKYVKYIRNIRTIQDYLCNRADKHLVPKINNTNVDRSVAAIHATVFSCLRRQEGGEKLYDPVTNTVPMVYDEHKSQCAANSFGSKLMFQMIQTLGSSRNLMALVNTDGSVAKAWPYDSYNVNQILTSNSGRDNSVGNDMYDPLLIFKAEPVNLQFGNFGISSWPNDTGCTSYIGSMDDSRNDGVDSRNRHCSSCSCSPRISGASKEPMEGMSVCGSEDEVDEPLAADSEDEHSYTEKEIHEEMEGSIDDESKSDEEYDDLALLDGLEEGYSFAYDGMADANRLFNGIYTQDKVAKDMGVKELIEKYQQSLHQHLVTNEDWHQSLNCKLLPERSQVNNKVNRKLAPSNNLSLHGQPEVPPSYDVHVVLGLTQRKLKAKPQL